MKKTPHKINTVHRKKTAKIINTAESENTTHNNVNGSCNNIIKSPRIQKILANQGLGSRRQIESWIKAGRITLNKTILTLGSCYDGKGILKLDGKILKVNKHTDKTQLLLYHKPTGEICSRNDPENRRTVFDSLPNLTVGRWISIGRLDITSSGLLLFTNNGELANKLMHPKSLIAREYGVRVSGTLDPNQKKSLLSGIQLEDGISKFAKVIAQGGQGRNQWYKVSLYRGRYREVRRMFEAIGLQVSALKRVKFGAINLPRHLKPGKYMNIEELANVKQMLQKL